VSISVQPESYQVPANTVRAARSVFHVENLYLAIGDQWAHLLRDQDPEELDSAFSEKPRCAALILAMVTLFQYAEDMPDRQAADAVRTRLDWKYALHLPLDHPGIEHASLGEFRQRIMHHLAGQGAFQRLLDCLAALGLLGSGEKREASAAAVLKAVETLTRVAEAARAMRQVLEALAAREPEWLRQIALPHWYERYGHPLGVGALPASEGERAVLLTAIGEDVSYLLEAAREARVPSLDALPEVLALRQLWQERLEWGEAGGPRRGASAPSTTNGTALGGECGINRVQAVGSITGQILEGG
jgi:hypothetical protein